MRRILLYLGIATLFGIILAGFFFFLQNARAKNEAVEAETTESRLSGSGQVNKQVKQVKGVPNPVVYFEIPVHSMARARQFYTQVFGFTFEAQVIDNNEMALFPFTDGAGGISGALAKGESYVPAKTGTLIYFLTPSIDNALAKVKTHGGKTLYPKTGIGVLGFVAEFEDSEGNRIGLHEKGYEQ